jgi:hypothetical protein
VLLLLADEGDGVATIEEGAIQCCCSERRKMEATAKGTG